MPISAQLLEILRCPACRGVVRPLPHDAGLECVACRRVYPIVDGIPNMLVEDLSSPQS